MNYIGVADMAAKLTSCFSTSLSLRRRYHLDNAENEYELPLEEVWNKESFSDDNLTAKNVKFDSARNGTRSRKTSAVFDQQIPSNEELHDDWMFIKKQSTKELVSNLTDLNQADFSMLKVGKHIIQLPQLQSSSQGYRLNKYNIWNTKQDMAATIPTQQSHFVDDEGGDILSGNMYI